MNNLEISNFTNAILLLNNSQDILFTTNSTVNGFLSSFENEINQIKGFGRYYEYE